MSNAKKTSLLTRLFCLAAVLILVGSLLSHGIDTSWGKVSVNEAKIVTDDGYRLAVTVYKPDGASAENPVPGVLLSHGGNGNRESMSSFAVEFARRGYAVINIDKFTNGDSDTVDIRSSGVIDAIKYFSGLAFVDSDNIAAIGHSASSIVNAAVDNNKYNVKLIISNGSTGSPGGSDFEPDAPFNVAYILGTLDENAGPGNWKVETPRDGYKSPVVKIYFGVTEDIVPGQWYGDLSKNTGRILYTPAAFHTWMRYQPSVVGLNLQLVAEILDGANEEMPTDQQVWYFKEFGYWMIMAGVVMLTFAMILYLTKRDFFAEAIVEPNEVQITRNAKFWVLTLATALVSLISTQFLYQTGKDIFSKVPWMRLEHTNGTVFWQFVTIFCMVVFNRILKLVQGKFDWKNDALVYKLPLKKIGKLVLAGLITFLACYAVAVTVRYLWGGHVKFLQTEVTVLSTTRLWQFLAFFPIYMFQQLLVTYSQVTGLRTKGGTTKSFLLLTMLCNTLSMFLFLAVFFISILVLGTSALHNSRFIATSVLVNMFPMMFVCSGVTVLSFKKTNSIYLGATINACIMTWMACGSVMLA